MKFTLSPCYRCIMDFKIMISTDKSRPLFLFTPPANWLNDPNGLVYYAGEYHLFYQYHPDSTVWGPMHWGHAVSTDLVTWQHLPIALYPDELGTIFSGSAVIDWHNTAGFGTEAMIALFTHHAPAGQSQSLAYSTNKGRTWTKYAGNPVIATPPGEKDFRDPKVFWYDARAGAGHWVMLLAVADSIWFYTSPNLIDWHFASEFGADQGSHAGVWETPDLFHLSAEHDKFYRPIGTHDLSRWVLMVGVGAGAAVDEQCTQYFVGDFDGTTFISENAPETVLRADYGPDFYAAQGWNDAPAGRKLWIAWMNNWVYARQIPTGDWRGLMTVVRQLTLHSTPAGLRLLQHPVDELASLRGQAQHWASQTVETTPFKLGIAPGIAVDEPMEIIVEFQVDDATTADHFGLRICTGDQAVVTIGYDTKQQELYIDRASTGETAFNPHFVGRYSAPLAPIDNTIQLQLLLDRCSVEVFGNHGLAVITALHFAQAAAKVIEVFAVGGKCIVQSLCVYRLNGRV